MASSDKYVGELNAAGQRHGRGKLTSADGSVLDGEWRHGHPHGQCEFRAANGDVYIGEFDSGQRQGEGTCTYANGDEYTGSWLEDVFHGQGKLRSAEGTYRGPWKNGLKHGPRGTFTWAATGDVYVGDWKLGVRTGTGTLTCAPAPGQEQGDIYRGEWLDNEKHGKGTQTSVDLEASIGGDRSVYEGHYRHGLREGQGTFHYWKGSYCGSWVGDERSGYGEFRYPDGEMHKGLYLHGRKEGPGFYRFATHEIFEGDFSAGVFHGLGAKWDADGTAIIHCGDWAQGDPTGEPHAIPIDILPVGHWLEGPGKSASLLLADGSTYTGPYNEQYQRNGRGVVHSRTGEELERGEWVADVLQAPSSSSSSSSAAASSSSATYAGMGVALLSSMILSPISTGVSGLSAIAAFAGSSLSYATAASTPSLDDSAAAAIAAAAAAESTTSSFDSSSSASHPSFAYNNSAASSSISASAMAAHDNANPHDRQIDL